MEGFDRRIIRPKPLPGTALGPVDAVGRPLEPLDVPRSEAWKDGLDLVGGSSQLLGRRAIDPRLGQLAPELPDHRTRGVVSTGHRDPRPVSIDAMAVECREPRGPDQGHVKRPPLGDARLETESAQEPLVPGPRGEHHRSGRKPDLSVLVPKDRGVHEPAPGGQFDSLGTGDPDQAIPVGGRDGLEDGPGLEDRLGDPEDLARNGSKDRRPIRSGDGLGPTTEGRPGTEHPDAGGETVRPPDPRAGTGDHGGAEIRPVFVRRLVHADPAGRHVPNRTGGTGIPFAEGVLQASVNDPLGRDALAPAEGDAFDANRAETGSGGRIENPEPGDAGSEDQEVDGLGTGLVHAATVPSSSPPGRGILMGPE